MSYRAKMFTCLLILVLPFALADDGFAGKKKKKKKGKKKKNSAEASETIAPAATPSAPSKVALEIERHLLAYDTQVDHSLRSEVVPKPSDRSDSRRSTPRPEDGLSRARIARRHRNRVTWQPACYVQKPEDKKEESP